MKPKRIASWILCSTASNPLPVLADISPPIPGAIGTFIPAILMILACVFAGLWLARKVRRKNLLEDRTLAKAIPSEPDSSSQPGTNLARCISALNMRLSRLTQNPHLGASSLVPILGAAIMVSIAALACAAPLKFSIATVFLFAVPHNWIEARYLVTRRHAVGNQRRSISWWPWPAPLASVFYLPCCLGWPELINGTSKVLHLHGLRGAAQ